MKVTYIHHSSFMVELEHVILLFDYYQGKIPKTEKRKPLFVFVSHRHEDHFSPEIFSLGKTHPDTTYILSDDIWENMVPEELYGKVYFMGSDEEEDFTEDGFPVRVRTYRSTDEGVAFLVDADGKRIYHAGDLNYWYWKEEDRSWNSSQKKDYHARLDEISAAVKQDSHIPDAAFVPVDSRLGESFYLGIDDFMKKVGSKAVFPMHTFDGGEVIEKLRKHKCAAGYSGIIYGTGKDNESFEV